LRYFFHFVSNGSVYEGPKGEQFSSLEEAMDNARIIAAQLKMDGSNRSTQLILVTDQKGTELARLAIDAERDCPNRANLSKLSGEAGSES